jgi:alkanesulfonate monooxygenase SsuD/methylene tetrahydromethanopterin reductase-like flavin-dependent oxidoreductase (luciferase family)
MGGNGPKVTWRLAARFADEVCLDALPPDAVAKALPVIRARCEEIGRDRPACGWRPTCGASRPPSPPARRGSGGCGSTPTSAWTGWSSSGSRPSAAPATWTRWWRTAPPSGLLEPAPDR